MTEPTTHTPDVANTRRYATHVAVILLVLVAAFVDRLPLPSASEASAFVQPRSEDEPQPVRVGEMPPPPPASFLSLTKAAVPRTVIPERAREEILIYKVQPGDTLFGIAQKFGISGETVMWANDQEGNPDILSIGQEMIILPVSGVYHTVAPGDTVEKIAARYKVEPGAITGYGPNGLEPPYALTTGQRIIVPGGQKPYVPRVVEAYSGPIPTDAARGTGIFGWPSSGMITQKYWGGHQAIDIGGRTGTPVYAADSGFVTVAGWSSVGYGNMIFIDHGNGFQTRYAHLNTIQVRQGQSVRKGQQIGTMGCTGRCTGPHLHFEIYKGGVPRNPIGILP